MAKLFNKKNKEPDNKGMQALSPEEQARADQLTVPREEMIAAMRKMGVPEEKIKEAFPDPLPRQEQEKMLNEVRKLFGAQKYKEVIATYSAPVNSGLLTDDALNETCFAIGVSAIVTADKDNISRYAGHTISYLLQSIKQLDTSKTLGTIRALMQMAEKQVPGCMKESGRKLYPALRSFLPEDDEFVCEIKGYM